MSWFFYSKEGKLLYDVVSGSLGDAATLDGIDSTGFVRLGAPGLNIGDVDIDGSLTLPVIANQTSDVTLTSAERTVLVNTQTPAAPITVTLPASPLTGQIYEIKDKGVSGTGYSATHNITIDGNGNNIMGSPTYVISDNGHGVVLVYSGFTWHVLAAVTPTGGAIDADTLDTLDSTQFLRSDVDDTAAGNITFDKSTYSPVDVLNDLTNPNLLNDTHRTVVADPATNSAPVTITLPSTPTVGQWYEIVDGKGGAAANNITINPNGNNINTSAASIVLNTNYDSIVLVCTAPTEWTIVAWRFPPSGPVAIGLNDLTDVTITGPTEGELLRYDTPANQWINVPSVTIDDTGSLNLVNPSTYFTLGSSLGISGAASIGWGANKTLDLYNRVRHMGTENRLLMILQNGVFPVGDTYVSSLPQDNSYMCKTGSGDLFIRICSGANLVSTPFNGDTLLVKDIDGAVGVNTLALVAEGVRKRNIPLLQVTSVTGTIADASSTLTPGGVGVDEVQELKVTGSGTFKITFDGVEAAAVLTETSDATAVKAAIESLSPHAIYGHFSVSTSGVDTLGGISVTFDGGTLIDGEASYYFSVPWQGIELVFLSDPSPFGAWLII